VHLSPH
jgi:hypothetical protein